MDDRIQQDLIIDITPKRDYGNLDISNYSKVLLFLMDSSPEFRVEVAKALDVVNQMMIDMSPFIDAQMKASKSLTDALESREADATQ